METSVHPLDQPLPPGLRSFVARAAPNLYLAPQWLELHARVALEPGERGVLLCVGPASDPQATLALCLGQHRHGPITLAQTRSLTNYYVLDWQVLRAGGPAQGLAQNVARSLVRGLRRLGNPLLRFEALEPAHADELQDLLEAGGYRCERDEAFVNWVEPAAGRDFDAYWAARPSQLRNTAQRRRRRLDEAFAVRTRICTGVEGVDEMLADYERVYARSWKPAEGHPEFIPGLIRLAAARGVLRLGVLYADDAPAAAHLWFIENGCARIYKLAYDQDFRVYSPGLALGVEMFRHALDVDRVALFDYGSGDEPYKRDWMTERRVRHGIQAIDLRRPTGLLIHGVMRLRGALRAWRGGEAQARARAWIDSGAPAPAGPSPLAPSRALRRNVARQRALESGSC